MGGEIGLIGSKILVVKNIRRRTYGPVIIEKTISVVLAFLQFVYRSSLIERCTLQGSEDFIMGLVKTSSEEARP